MTKDELKFMIDETINSNGTQGITGKSLNLALSQIVEAIGEEFDGKEVVIERNDVNFFDYDGTLLYSYTWEEAKELTRLPELPTHDGLEVREWNYTLADIKAQGTETTIGRVDVGACVYDGDGAQVRPFGVYIFERGTHTLTFTDAGNSIIYETIAGVVSIPNTVEHIYDGFAYGSLFLNELKFPISVYSISDYYGAIQMCTINNLWWNGNNRDFYMTYNSNQINKLEIPETYTSISGDIQMSFYIVFPSRLESVYEISKYDSYYGGITLCDFRKSLIIPDLITSFRYKNNIMVVVPDNLYDEWINATNWSEIADNIYKASELPWLSNL